MAASAVTRVMAAARCIFGKLQVGIDGIDLLLQRDVLLFGLDHLLEFFVGVGDFFGPAIHSFAVALARRLA